MLLVRHQRFRECFADLTNDRALTGPTRPDRIPRRNRQAPRRSWWRVRRPRPGALRPGQVGLTRFLRGLELRRVGIDPVSPCPRFVPGHRRRHCGISDRGSWGPRGCACTGELQGAFLHLGLLRRARGHLRGRVLAARLFRRLELRRLWIRAVAVVVAGCVCRLRSVRGIQAPRGCACTARTRPSSAGCSRCFPGRMSCPARGRAAGRAGREVRDTRAR